MKKIIIASIVSVTLVGVSVGALVSSNESLERTKSDLAQLTKVNEVEPVAVQDEVKPVEPVAVVESELIETPVVEQVETVDEKFERLIMTTYSEYNKDGMSGIAYSLKSRYPEQYTVDNMEQSLANLYADYDAFIADGGNYSLFMRKVL